MARTLRTRRPATRKLNVQTFDERVLPSAAVALSADGTLSITADSQRADVIVMPAGSLIKVRNDAAHQVTTWPAADVKRIAFTGGPGNDRFENDTDLPSRATGGLGNDSLIGGFGDDVFVGSPGRDVYTGNGGGDLLIRNGYRVNFTDASDKNAVVGVFTGRLTPAELKADGDLTVWLDGNRLWLNGPTGAGFALRSDGWQAAVGGSDMKFQTSAAVTLESAWGDIPLPTGGQELIVTATATRVAGVGIFDDVSWAGADITFSSPTGEYATQLGDLTGGSVGLPNMSWGIALGSDVGDDAAPLNPAVPYLFATAGSGYSFGYENVSVSPDYTYRGTFAFAPGDGTIYAGITGLPVIGDFALGVSTNGYLPYVPDRIPVGTTDPNIYGHFYVRGQVSLDDAGVPVAFGGNLLLDLDANDDGKLLGGAWDVDRIAHVVHAFEDNVDNPTKLLGSTLRSTFQDVQIGVNTNLDLSFHGLNMNLSRSSFWMTPNEIAFRAKTSNPFEGIPYLKDVPMPLGLDVQGFLRRNGTWRASFDAQSGIPGFASGLHVEAGSGLNGFRVTALVKVDLGALGQVNVWATGTVFFNGDYRLEGHTRVNLGVSEPTMNLVIGKARGKPYAIVSFT
jgi:hypothetical protein